MRRSATAVVALLLAVGSLAATTDGPRTVEGVVLAEAPTSQAAICAWLNGGRASQGKVGWIVELAPEEGDGLHAFELRSRVQALGVTFYDALGTCAEPGRALTPDRPLLASETDGIIPFGARFAVIGRWSATAGGFYYTLPPVHVRTGVGLATPFTFVISDAIR